MGRLIFRIMVLFVELLPAAQQFLDLRQVAGNPIDGRIMDLKELQQFALRQGNHVPGGAEVDEEGRWIKGRLRMHDGQFTRS